MVHLLKLRCFPLYRFYFSHYLLSRFYSLNNIKLDSGESNLEPIFRTVHTLLNWQSDWAMLEVGSCMDAYSEFSISLTFTFPLSLSQLFASSSLLSPSSDQLSSKELVLEALQALEHLSLADNLHTLSESFSRLFRTLKA